jgi:cellulose biosynthesis protein BcsQ
VKVLATYSIKGGVGKTTSAVNLAYAASTSGSRVLLWDLDPQAAATYFFRVKPKVKGGSLRLVGGKGELASHIRATDEPSLHLLPADFSLRNLDVHLDATKRPLDRLASLLAGVADRYDVAFLDCPPSISLASESVFGAADALLVPVIPTTLSGRTLGQLAGFLEGKDGAPSVLPYFSMVDRRKRLHRELLEALRADWPGFLPTVIPSASVIERMGPERGPVAAFAPSSPAAEAFRSLWADAAARLWR